MMKANREINNDLRPEYDFANMKVGVRGKCAAKTFENLGSSPFFETRENGKSITDRGRS